jgi:hypothetical protein
MKKKGRSGLTERSRMLRVGSCRAVWPYFAVRVGSCRVLFRVMRLACHACRALPPRAAKADTHDSFGPWSAHTETGLKSIGIGLCRFVGTAPSIFGLTSSGLGPDLGPKSAIPAGFC